MLLMLSKGLELDLAEFFVFSFFASYGVVGLISLLLLPVPAAARSLVLPATMAAYAALFLHWLRDREEVVRKALVLPTKADSMVLAGILALAAYHISLAAVAYPGLGHLAYADQSRHVSWARAIWRAPRLYNGGYPPFLRVHLGLAAHFSDFMDGALKGALSGLSLIVPLAAFILAKRILGPDQRVHALLSAALVDLTIGSSGLAWVKRLAKGLPITTVEYYQYGLLYSPYVLSFGGILFLSWLYLLSAEYRETQASSQLAAVAGILSLGMFLTHIVEVTILSLSLFLHALLTEDRPRKYNVGISLGSLLGGAALIALDQWMPLFSPDSKLIAISILPAALLASIDIARRALRTLRSNVRGGVLGRSALLPSLTPYLIIFVYASSVMLWMLGEQSPLKSFTMADVPWYYYAPLLGLSGMMGAIYVVKSYVNGDLKRDPYLRKALPVCVAASAAIVGTVVGLANSHLFFTGYSELRMVPITRGFLAILAPAAALELKKFGNLARRVAVPILIILVIVMEAIPVISGTYAVVSLASKGSGLNLSASREVFLRLEADPTAYAVATDLNSFKHAILAGSPATRVPISAQLYFDMLCSDSPEPVLAALSPPMIPSAMSSHMYLITQGQGVLQDGFLEGILSWLKPQKAGDVSVYDLPRYHPTPSRSTVAYIIPINHRLVPVWASAIVASSISNGAFNVTAVVDGDPRAFVDYRAIILPYDPPRGDLIEERRVLREDEVKTIPVAWDETIDLSDLLSSMLPPRSVKVTYLNLSGGPVVSASISVEISPVGGVLVHREGLVSIVYSIRPDGGYESVGILFRRDGEIYAILMAKEPDAGVVKIRDFDRVGSWSRKGQMNLTFKASAERMEVEVNGEELYRRRGEFSLDGIVLGVSRGLRVVSIGKVVSQSKRWLDYGPYTTSSRILGYVEGGGVAIVYNLNGYGSLSQEILDTSAMKLNATEVSGEGITIGIPRPLEVQGASIRTDLDGAAEVLAWYVGDGRRAPAVVKLRMGSGVVYLVNAFPLRQYLESEERLDKDGLEAVHKILDIPLEDLGISTLAPTWTPYMSWGEFDGYLGTLLTENMSLVGSSALILPANPSSLSLFVENLSKGNESFRNLSAVAVLSGPGLTAHLRDPKITSAPSAFYAAIRTENSILDLDGPSKLILQFTNGSTLTLGTHTAKAWIAVTGLHELVMRRPTVVSSGRTETRFYLSKVARMSINQYKERRLIFDDGLSFSWEFKFGPLVAIKNLSYTSYRIDPPLRGVGAGWREMSAAFLLSLVLTIIVALTSARGAPQSHVRRDFEGISSPKPPCYSSLESSSWLLPPSL